MTASLETHSDRVIGCFIGGMCGDVLGCSVEGWTSARIQRKYPTGLTDFQDNGRGYGCYTDDTNMMIALATSLVRKGGCCPEDCAGEYSRMFQPWRGYGGTAVKILQALKDGEHYSLTGTMFMPEGSYANGGAMRIAPVGLAYRNASNGTMRQAVADALLCTHVHPCAIDGAMVQARATAFLCSTTVSEFVPSQFLDSLLTAVETEEMKGKLEHLKESLGEIKSHEGVKNDDWAQHFASPSWEFTTKLADKVADEFQIKATDAVAVTLLSFLLHWRSPQNAIICAVHLGGDTDTVACMVGGLVGALYGREWVPSRWFDNLENEEYGRDMVLGLAEKLVELDVRDV